MGGSPYNGCHSHCDSLGIENNRKPNYIEFLYYLFVIDRGAAVAEGESSAKQLIENELVKKTKAYKNDNIVYLNPDFWYLSGGGLVSVSEMVKEVEEGTK